MAEAETQPAEGAPAEAPADAAPPLQPIIIKKVFEEDGHAGAHGGAWKIALADMMTAIIDPDGFPFSAKQTAMLERLTPQAQGGPAESFGSSQEENNKDGPSDQDPGKPSGSGQGQGTGGSASQKQDKDNFDKLEKDLKQKLSESKQFEKIKDQVSITRDSEGMRIEVIDKANFSMFSSGTADMGGQAAALMSEVAKSLKPLPNKLAIRGHTDSTGFAPDSMRNNWTLSTERADATRQLMQGAGIGSNRFTKIEGVADTAPFIPNNPADPRNRRVSITVLNQ